MAFSLVPSGQAHRELRGGLPQQAGLPGAAKMGKTPINVQALHSGYGKVLSPGGGSPRVCGYCVLETLLLDPLTQRQHQLLCSRVLVAPGLFVCPQDV